MQGRIETSSAPFSDQEKGAGGDEVAAQRPGALPPPDLGLYAVLGLEPTASDAEILTAYRRRAAHLLADGASSGVALRQLNTAYEVLSNPLRRQEYDRLRAAYTGVLQASVPPQPAGKRPAAPRRPRRRPRQSMQPRYPGLGDVFVVLAVVGLSLVAGALLIPHLSINLSGLSALQFVMPVGLTAQRAPASTVTPAPSSTAMATPSPDLAQRFAASRVAVSNPTPAPNSFESIVVTLRDGGKPAANVQVWATVQYRTTQERWPATGTVTTDASGAATLSSNIGSATPDYPVQVHVFAVVQDETLSWSTSFTPH